ncbi:MAG: hypothetical protein HY736_19005 [Verrucomicrobia bacterium]|nr:hypothetical protein [Verrucomicrobiota bacterium]
MNSRSLATLLVVGSLFVGGCATPSGKAVRWPVVPRTRAEAATATAVGLPTHVLPRLELQSQLAMAGVFFPMMSDESYVRIEHAALPALLDWYEAMIAVYGVKPERLDEEGFQRDRAVRILRVFVTMRMARHPEPLEAAPAVGLVRVNLLQPCGNFASGEIHDFLAVATERGMFLLDPVSRRICPLEFDPFFWHFEEARF